MLQGLFCFSDLLILLNFAALWVLLFNGLLTHTHTFAFIITSKISFLHTITLPHYKPFTILAIQFLTYFRHILSCNYRNISFQFFCLMPVYFISTSLQASSKTVNQTPQCCGSFCLSNSCKDCLLLSYGLHDHSEQSVIYCDAKGKSHLSSLS